MEVKFGKIRIANFKTPSISELILLLYISSVILLSMIPIGNIVSKIIGLVLLYTFFVAIFKTNKKIYFSREVYIILGWLLFCLISGFAARDINLVYVKMFTLIQLLIFFVVGYTIIFKGNIRVKSIFYVFIISVTIAFLYGLLTQGNSAVVVIRNRIVGTAGDPNQIAVFGAFSIIFAGYLLMIEKKSLIKIFLIALITILIIGIIKTQSRQGLLLIVISAITFLVVSNLHQFKNSDNKKRIIIKFILIFFVSFIIISIILYFFKQSDYYYRIQALVAFIKISFGSSSDNITKMIDYSAYERKKLILFGIRIWLDHPLIGVGLDNFRVVIKEYWPISNRLYSHNNYIELLSTIGTVGTVLYYGIYFSIIKKINTVTKTLDYGHKNIKLMQILITIVISLMVLDMVTVTYYAKFTWILFMVILGYTDRLSNLNQIEKPS